MDKLSQDVPDIFRSVPQPSFSNNETNCDLSEHDFHNIQQPIQDSGVSSMLFLMMMMMMMAKWFSEFPVKNVLSFHSTCIACDLLNLLINTQVTQAHV